MKARNQLVGNVLWNGEEISEKMQEENYQHIKDYSTQTVKQGYLCSINDPFLFLLAKILNVNINHQYLNNTISYEIIDAVETIYFSSSKGHFVFRHRKAHRKK